MMTSNYVRVAAGLLGLMVVLGTALGQTPAGSIEGGVLPDHWLTGGPRCMEMPEWQVHEYNPRLFVLRQSGCTDYEKPFLYLLFGTQRALLLDTGSINGNLAPTLQRTVHRWLLRNDRGSIPLLVVHTHAHGDHVAGDQELIALKDPRLPVTLIPATVEAELTAFHIQHWPDEAGSIDLGERVVDVIPIPGHSDTSVAYYDRKTGILFPGDSLYPGRLYIRDFDAFQKSTQRLVRFTAQKPVTHILGNHIEQTRTPFVDYPTGTMYQPDEHELALSRGSLLELDEALNALQGTPRRVRLRDFTLWPKATAEVERAAEEKDYQEVNGLQRKRMWDQTRP